MTTPARILVVTSGSLSRNPRPAKEAMTLARAGYDVTVLHPSEGVQYDRLDAELAAGAGYRTEVVDAAVTPAGNLSRRMQRWLARRVVPLGIEHPATLGNGRTLLARARALAADLTIVHNEISFWVGRQLLNEGRRVAADIEDWHSEDLPVQARHHRPLRLLRGLESAMLHDAAYVSTTSTALSAALFERYGGKRPAVITNSFPLQSDPRTARPPGDNVPSFFWFSQTVGPGRGLEAFLHVWAQLTSPSRLVLLGEPQAGFADHLRSQVPPALRPRLEFHELVAPQRLASVISRHDIGLALEENSIRSRDLTITNKLLQYLNAGLAVVATETTGQREALDSAPGAGLLIGTGDLRAAAARIDSWVRDQPQLDRAQRAARAAAEKTFCWEREEPKLLALVHQALFSR